MAKKILIVDDERTIADTLSVIFRGLGYETFAAYNGLLGLDAARNIDPDLILTDVFMPGMDGVQMAIEIRATLPHIKVLLFSGQASTADLLQVAENLGFHFEVMQKPIRPEEIIRQVKQALAKAA